MRQTDLVLDLRGRIASGALLPGERLPGIRSLAKHYHCAPVTVLAGLKALVVEHLVEVRRGSGYRVCAAASSPSEPADRQPTFLPRLSAAETIAATLREEILSGKGASTLASAKELRRRFGCSHHTLVDALAALEQSGLLRRRGSRYRAGAAEAEGAGLPVHFLSPERRVQGSALPLVMSLERELEEHGWARMHFVDPAKEALPAAHQTAGFVYFQADSASGWADSLNRPVPVPTVVVDMHEAGMTDAQNRPYVYRIFPDNRRAGSDLASHLSKLGHKRCAYISSLRLDEGCALLRLQGVNQVFATKGNHDKRTCSVYDASRTEWPSLPGMTEMNRGLAAFRQTVSRASKLPERFVREWFDGAFSAVHWWSHYAGLRELFRSVLVESSITAWVCSDDSTAMLAHAFLQGPGRTPGRDIALASFDNSWLSYELGITSYDLGFDRMGHMAFQCLAAPQQVVRSGRTNVHAPGQLVTRDSTSRTRA
jgi:DNA-binding LacI/PurR family transcriptional regulator/DNA-binding transcriptional regulator YhcF (GntR family)